MTAVIFLYISGQKQLIVPVCDLITAGVVDKVMGWVGSWRYHNNTTCVHSFRFVYFPKQWRNFLLHS